MQEIYHELPIILTIFDFFKSKKRREKERMKAPVQKEQREANNDLTTKSPQLEFEKRPFNRFSEDPNRRLKNQFTLKQTEKAIPE